MKARANAIANLLMTASYFGEQRKLIDKLDDFKKVIFKVDGLNDKMDRE